MRRRLCLDALGFWGMFLAAPFPAAAQQVIGDHALSGDEIALTDGRLVRLDGIKAAMPEAKDFLDAEISGYALDMPDVGVDRYGRWAARVTVAGQATSVQEDLLRQGLGFVYPATGDVDALLTAEGEARGARRGFWALLRDAAAETADMALCGRYAFVVGRVVKAERVKNKVYLNFGADWRTDFTVAVAAHDLRAFKKANVDLLSLAGKKVRIRGWVKRDFGPMITVTDPHQIQILE